MIGESLALDQDGQERPAAGVDQTALLEQLGVDVIEQKAGPGREIHQPPPLRREVSLTAEGGDQFRFHTKELDSGASGTVLDPRGAPS